MKTTVTYYEFRDTFNYVRPDNFSSNALIALSEYIEELEEDCGIEIEFDVIALCCDYVEYECWEDFWAEYDKEDFPDEDTLRDHTTFISVKGGGFIIGAF